ncbi:MAG: RNase P/RNase MRP subunit p30, partial [Planctomycetota bacterium]
MSFVFRLSATLAASLALVASANSQSPPASQPTAISNVRLVNDVDAPRVSILLRNGRIVKVLDAGMDLPAAYRQIDGEGGLALPAFIDGFSTAGVSTPAPVSKKDAMSELDGNVHAGMREANRKGLQPALDVLTVLELSESDLEGYREQGFAAVHSNASGEILAGQSCVVSLADGALRDRVVASEIYQAAALRASGDGYPSTLMGYLSHLRQFFLDARRHALRLNRYGKQNTDRRPPHDPDLESMSAIFGHKQRIVCHADSARDIRRWMKFAKAQDVQIAISGGREAWMVAAELAEAKIPVFLSLDWGDEVDDPDEDEEADEEAEGDEEASADETSGEPEEEVVVVEVESDEFQAKDLEPSATEPGDEEDAEEKDKAVNWKYEEPVGIQRERRRKWEERRDCAIRLNESGVIFVLGTIGESPKDLLKNVRKLVELGLPDDVALAAMTRRVSLVLGIEERVGKLEAGHDA